MEDMLKVSLRNAGGELDSRTVFLTSEKIAAGETPVKTALLEMLDGIDLAEGDRVVVEYSEG